MMNELLHDINKPLRPEKDPVPQVRGLRRAHSIEADVLVVMAEHFSSDAQVQHRSLHKLWVSHNFRVRPAVLRLQ